MRSSRLRASRRLATLGGACLVAATSLAPGAAADPFSDGQWYATAFKLAQNHTIADGSGVTVAVLDGPISTSAPSLAGADVVPAATSLCLDASGASPTVVDGEVANHGTEMTSMIVGRGGPDAPLGVAPGAKALTYTIGYDDPGNAEDTTLTCSRAAGGADVDSAAAAAIQDAVSKGARIVNMSFGGRSATPAIQVAVLYAMRKGVVFVAATDDTTSPGTRVLPPGSLNGVVLVNGIDRTTKLLGVSAAGPQDGPLVVASAPGSELSLGGYLNGAWDPSAYVTGSSPAAAFVTGVLAATLSKYPEATGNQLIQSLARNTSGEEHPIDPRAQDGYGYGVVSLTSMLAHDPTAYPDENPTLRDGALPSTGDILGTSSSAPATPSSAEVSTPAGSGSASRPSVAVRDAADDGVSTGLVVGLGVGGLMLLLVVIGVVALIVHRHRRSGPPPSPPFTPSAPGGWSGP